MSTNMEDKNGEVAERRSNTYAALGVGLVCLLVGVPIWLRTTTVYRAYLPYSEIEDLARLKLVARVPVLVVVFDEEIRSDLLPFTDKLQNSLEGREVLDPRLALEHVTSVRHATESELRLFLEHPDLNELEAGLSHVTEQYACAIVLLPKSFSARSTPPQDTAVVGRTKLAFIRANPDLEETARRISVLVRNVFSGEKALSNALKHATGTTQQQTDKAGMRSVRAHSGYSLTFTLLQPQPEVVRVVWDMYRAEAVYLEPLQRKLANFTNLVIKSQHVYKTSLGVRPRKEERRSVLEEGDLPHIINPVEAFLGSHVDNQPTLNLIVYIPSRDQHPLHILHSNGEPSKTNSFLSPRWGSVLIYNPGELPENASLPYTHHLDMEKVMGVLLPHIKLLLGLQTQLSLPGVEFLPAGDDMLTDWELDSWLRVGCVENTLSSVTTLTSLADLLQKINNIVINDVIASHVEEAVRMIKQSATQLAAGELHQAYISSKRAVQASEKAFFDPSLLELLYFPEDQKFAIYIPLFLPVGIPVGMSLLQAVKRYRKQRQEKSKTE